MPKARAIWGQIDYERTVLEHYAALWQYGVPVDIIGVEDDFSKYKVISAPMLYMCSEETGRKLEQFVENGGTLVWHLLVRCC